MLPAVAFVAVSVLQTVLGEGEVIRRPLFWSSETASVASVPAPSLLKQEGDVAGAEKTMSGMETPSTPGGIREAHHQHGLYGKSFDLATAVNETLSQLLHQLRNRHDLPSHARLAQINGDQNDITKGCRRRKHDHSIDIRRWKKTGTDIYVYLRSPVVRQSFLVEMAPLHVHHFFHCGVFLGHCSADVCCAPPFASIWGADISYCRRKCL